MEQDCRERYERKKASEKEALALKELGNKEFQKENYKKAIDFYTEVVFNLYILFINDLILKYCH